MNKPYPEDPIIELVKGLDIPTESRETLIKYLNNQRHLSMNDGFKFPEHDGISCGAKPIIPLSIMMYFFQDTVEIVDMNYNRFIVCATCNPFLGVPEDVRNMRVNKIWEGSNSTQVQVRGHFKQEDFTEHRCCIDHVFKPCSN